MRVVSNVDFITLDSLTSPISLEYLHPCKNFSFIYVDEHSSSVISTYFLSLTVWSIDKPSLGGFTYVYISYLLSLITYFQTRNLRASGHIIDWCLIN